MASDRRLGRTPRATSQPDGSSDLPSPSGELATVADSVVHDLGNLLAVMVGQVSLLEPLVKSNTEGRESLAEIKRAIAESVARLHDLVAALRKASVD